LGASGGAATDQVAQNLYVNVFEVFADGRTKRNQFNTNIYNVLRKKYSLRQADPKNVFNYFFCTVKHAYNDHPWDPKLLAVVDRWLLFIGHFYNKGPIRDILIEIVEDRWTLFGGGR
jgi:hypothetical protein